MNLPGILLGAFLVAIGICLHLYYQGRFAQSEEAKESVEKLVESLPAWFVKLAPVVLVVGGILRLYLAIFASEPSA